MKSEQKKRRKLQGVVMSDTMNKTRTVEVRRTKVHPKYKKRFTVSKRYLVHDEKNEYHTGDIVGFEEPRPLSRHKRWRMIEKIEKK